MSSELVHSYLNHEDCQKNQNKLKIILAVASFSELPYLDISGKCYDITLTNTIDYEFIEAFYSVKLPSFKAYNETGKIIISNHDFANLIKYHNSYINDVCAITGKNYDQVALDFAQYHKGKEFLLQTHGLSGVIHKLTNYGYVSASGVQTFLATSSSHVSGVKNIALLGSTPSLIIFVPMLFGIGFASLERLTVGTVVQPFMLIARDTCLLPLKVTEIAYNDIFIGPMLRMFNIDAPLNITSMLKFGNGTKRILGAAVNATLNNTVVNKIKEASPAIASVTLDVFKNKK